MRLILLGLMAATAMLSACSQMRYCKGEQKYQAVQSLPPLEGTDGLEIPQSQAALRVPPGPGTSDGFVESYIDDEGETRLRCLDMPPRLAGSDAPGEGA